MMERRLVLGFHPQFKLVPLVLWLGERRVFFITLNESQTLAEGMKRVKISTLWFILCYTAWLGVQEEVSGCFSLLFFFSKCHLSAAWCLQQIHSLNIQLFSALIKDT